MGSILLVESDPDTRDRLGTVLREANHEVLLAASTSEALLRIGEGGIDVVVIDSYDPRVGVTDLVRNMQTLPDTPPVVLVSASPFAPEISARVGVAAFLPKPLGLGELAEAVDRLVAHTRPVRLIEEDDFGDEEPTGRARLYG